MNKIKKLTPNKIAVIGHQVVIPEKLFNAIIDTLTEQTNTINTLIDTVESLDAQVNTDTDNIKKLAKALETFMEE